MQQPKTGESGADLRRSDRFLGFTYSISRTAVAAALSALVKWIGLAVPVGQVMFVRSATAVLVLLLIAWRMQKLSTLSLRKWLSYAPRTIFATLAMVSWFSALPRAPLANLSAMGYTTAIFSALFGMFFLGERVSPLQWVWVMTGFIGVLIMTGPHLTLADASLLGMLFALGASVFSALVGIFTREMSRNEDTVAVCFYFAVTSTVAASFTVVGGEAIGGDWVMPGPREWLAFGLMGLVGTCVALLGNSAVRYAEISALAPLQYLGLVTAVLSGYWLFDEVPEMSFWTGLPLLLLPSLVTMWTAYRARRGVQVSL